jgi:hypothetical protein
VVVVLTDPVVSTRVDFAEDSYPEKNQNIVSIISSVFRKYAW